MTIASGSPARAADILAALNGARSIGSSGCFYQDHGAVVVRFGDRLLLGAAADNPADANRNVAPTDWLTSVMGATSIGAYATWGATTASLARYGQIGMLGASRTSDAYANSPMLGYTPSSIGIASWAIDDDVRSPRSTNAYAYYGEVWRMAGVAYQPSFAMELECVNFGGVAPGQSNPFHVNNGGGIYGIQLGAGGGQTSGTSDAEAGITFVNNPNCWRVGVIFGATALTGTDGATGGYGSAMQLAPYQGIEWRTPETVSNVQGAETGAFIRSTVTAAAQGARMEFQNGAVQFTNGSGQGLFAFLVNPNPNNTLNIQAGSGQQAAGLYVSEGTNGSANLGLYPASGGELQMSSPVTTGGNLPTGTAVAYLHINVNGTDYRIPLLTPTQAGT